jgi:hypothetical protein
MHDPTFFLFMCSLYHIKMGFICQIDFFAALELSVIQAGGFRAPLASGMGQALCSHRPFSIHKGWILAKAKAAPISRQAGRSAFNIFDGEESERRLGSEEALLWILIQ